MATALEKDDTNVAAYHILTCAVCKQELKKPKLLPCQHSFCTHCLTARYFIMDEFNDLYVSCPSCQAMHHLEDYKVESLPDNYLYDIVKEADGRALYSNPRCIPCNEGKQITIASHKCLDCGDTLCDSCYEWHCKFTATKHHVVVAVSDLKKGKFKEEFAARKVRYCYEHSTDDQKIPMSSYCDDCQCLACFECMHGGHKGHVFTKINRVREMQQQRSIQLLSSLERSLKYQEKRMKNIEKTIADTKQIWKQQETEIYDTANALHDMIDKIKEKKIDKLTMQYKTELGFLDTTLNEERNKMESLEATLAFGKMFLETSSDSDFLYHLNDVRTRIDSSHRNLSHGFGMTIVRIERVKMDAAKQVLKGVIGKIELEGKCCLHRCKIGRMREDWRESIPTNMVYSLSYDPKEREILVSGKDEDGRIMIFNESRSFKRTITIENSNRPFGIHSNESGIFYTTFLKDKRMVVHGNKNGIIIDSVRLPENDTEINGMLGIVVDDDNNAFIASNATGRIYKWIQDEDKLSTFLSKEMGHDISTPAYLCLTPAGDLVVSNSAPPNIQVYSKKGELQWNYGGKAESFPLKNPSGICCDEDGYIYVVDMEDCRIHVIHDQKCIGTVPISREVRESSFVPLIMIPGGYLIYGYGNNIVKISFWDNNE